MAHVKVSTNPKTTLRALESVTNAIPKQGILVYFNLILILKSFLFVSKKAKFLITLLMKWPAFGQCGLQNSDRLSFW